MMVFIRLLIFIKTYKKDRFSQMITNKKDSNRFSQMVTNKNAYK